MSNSHSTLRELLKRLSNEIAECLAGTPYTAPESSSVSVKAFLQPLLLPPPSDASNTTTALSDSIKDFALACTLLSSASTFKPFTSDQSTLLSWIPTHLSSLAAASFLEFSQQYAAAAADEGGIFDNVAEFGLSCDSLPKEKRLVVELVPEVLPLLKERIKESSIDKSDDNDEFSAASARVPVGFAVLAAFQLRWFVTQVDYPLLGKFYGLVIPCSLTAIDHWSPEVKGQGMVCFAHLGKNVAAAEIGSYADVILDACCQNIASTDEIWQQVVETSVVISTLTQRSNPRSPWFEKMLNEMLSHLERQPKNKERRIAWLKFSDSIFNAVGLVLLAHFRRIFPLFFQWMHVDDDETLILVLKCTYVVLRLTWVRNSPYVERLVDELALVYKEAALRTAREEVRSNIYQILILLQGTKGQHFAAAWEKHRSDPNLAKLDLPLSGRDSITPPPQHCHQQGSTPPSNMIR
ncbi:uncharacterized protein At2g39910 [Arachis hypogaea]|uniref:uncharacterized protein At2g39910 n=1 Tax=Arachis hypogaea TaxID=3818 RepID=UPI000DED9EB4|nr:uncharacterized protein At2g39910 [Arachis hypogaea]QHN82122.1 uncharacterized protein DS421_20g692920 [Arachis hypogaea]